MNIVGEQLYPEISEQIKVRQRIYGSQNRTPQQLEYLNARTAYVKLVSSVNIESNFLPTSPELINLKNQGKLNSNKLAKSFVLFNGTQDADTNKGRGGISRDGSVVNSAAYGLGGLEFGIRPMPGILSAEVKTENRGSLKTSTVRIKAWNRTQFEIIDLLYLRLGYSVLLEFGNAIYFKNDGKTFITNRPFSLEAAFLKGGFSTQPLLEEIQRVRLASNGNYDAIYGRVVNFSWSFVEDGSYDITIIIRSIGDVIESLKANVLVKDITTPEGEQNDQTGESPPIEAFKDKHQIGRLLFDAQKILASSSDVKGGCTSLETDLLKTIPKISNLKHFLKQDFSGKTKSSQYYIRLGSLLAFIENKVIPKFVKGAKKEPILSFDYDTESNLVYRTVGQLSMDPRVCLISVNRKYPSGNTYYYASEGEPYAHTIADTPIGKVMNVYVNFEFILTKLEENLNPSNKSALIDLLTSLLSGINQAIGGVNTLNPFIDVDLNLVKVIDETPLPNKENILSSLGLGRTDPAILDLYGYYNRNGVSSAGFVRNFGIKTEISPDLATMLTIGAQAAGSVIGEDATGLSKLNEGLTDRISPTKVDAESQNPLDDEESKLADLNNRFPKAYKDFTTSANSLGSLNDSIPTWDDESINTYYQKQIDFLAYNNAKKAIEGKQASGGIGFIPVSLNLTLDGISGIKIYNSLRVDTAYLPSNYPNSMDFLITGISDKIENNVWTKYLTTIMVPKSPTQGDGNPPTQGSSTSTNSTPPPTNSTPPPRAESRNQGPRDCNAENIQLSTNFSLSQLSCSAPAAAYYIPAVGETKNHPSRGTLTRDDIIANLRDVAQNVLEPIKAAYPTMFPTNGYRNKGGTSQHEAGEATDIQFTDITGPISSQNAEFLIRAEAIRRILTARNGFDQFLLEYKTTKSKTPWLHISYRNPTSNRKEIRTFLNDVTAKNGNGKFYNALA